LAGISSASGYRAAAGASGTISGEGAGVVNCCAARCGGLATTPVILMKKQTRLMTSTKKRRPHRSRYSSALPRVLQECADPAGCRIEPREQNRAGSDRTVRLRFMFVASTTT